MLEVPVILPDGHRPIESPDGGRRPKARRASRPSRTTSRSDRAGTDRRARRRSRRGSGRDGDVDHFRFEARKGKRLIVEVFGRRLGTSIDPVIEILDDRGTPVPRAVLRPVAQTEVAFRDHDSTKPGIRLTQWNNLAIDDSVLIGRELIRIQALPRNPDDDCIFWNAQGQRVGAPGDDPRASPDGPADLQGRDPSARARPSPPAGWPP